MNSVCVWRLEQAAAGLFVKSFLRMRCSLLAALCARSRWAAWPAAFSFAGLLIAMLFSRSTCIRTLPLAALGVGLMLLSLLCFSILPAVIFMRTGVAQTAGSRAKVAGISQTARQRLRSNVLLGTQVSLSLLLSTMSACFAATLVHWETVDVGMDREHVLIVRPELHEPRYTDHREMLPELYRRIQERLQALPGVRSAAVGNVRRHSLRLDYGSLRAWPQRSYGRAGAWAGRSCRSWFLFHARHSNSARTRFLFERHRQDAAVAIISRSYARQLFGDADPIGQWVGYEPAPNDHKFLIVGEVADARVNGAQREAPPMVYMSINQNPAPINSIRVRAVGDPRQLSESVRQALHEVDPTLPVSEIVPLATELNGDLGTEKLLARLAGIYASLTLLLVAIGFYGVMSSRTARRKSEFGIRLALGATRRHISDAHRRSDRAHPARRHPSRRGSIHSCGEHRESSSVRVCQREFARNHRRKPRARIRGFRCHVHSCAPRGILPIRWKHFAANDRTAIPELAGRVVFSLSNSHWAAPGCPSPASASLAVLVAAEARTPPGSRHILQSSLPAPCSAYLVAEPTYPLC